MPLAGMSLDSGSGLYFVRARTYDAKTGRFTSRDPSVGRRHEPVSYHPIAFANSNPLLYSDRTGRSSLAELSAITSTAFSSSAVGEAGRYFMAFFKARHLYNDESAFAAKHFGSSITIGSVKVAGGASRSNVRPLLPHFLHLQDENFESDDDKFSIDNYWVFAHELMHTWQFENRWVDTMLSNLEIDALGQGGDPYFYHPSITDPRTVFQMFLNENSEAQASMVADYIITGNSKFALLGDYLKNPSWATAESLLNGRGL